MKFFALVLVCVLALFAFTPAPSADAAIPGSVARARALALRRAFVPRAFIPRAFIPRAPRAFVPRSIFAAQQFYGHQQQQFQFQIQRQRFFAPQSYYAPQQAFFAPQADCYAPPAQVFQVPQYAPACSAGSYSAPAVLDAGCGCGSSASSFLRRFR